VRQFVYDAAGRRTAEKWFAAGSGTGGTPSRTINYAYDAADQFVSAWDVDSKYTLGYDLAGRLTTLDNAAVVAGVLTETPTVPRVLLTYSYDTGNKKGTFSILFGSICAMCRL